MTCLPCSHWHSQLPSHLLYFLFLAGGMGWRERTIWAYFALKRNPGSGWELPTRVARAVTVTPGKPGTSRVNGRLKTTLPPDICCPPVDSGKRPGPLSWWCTPSSVNQDQPALVAEANALFTKEERQKECARCKAVVRVLVVTGPGEQPTDADLAALVAGLPA